jgi:hypothetical protein
MRIEPWADTFARWAVIAANFAGWLGIVSGFLWLTSR